MGENHKESEYSNTLSDTAPLDRDVDIIEEFRISLDEIEKAANELGSDIILEKASYLKFLLQELADSLKGDLEWLRHRRVIIKKS